MQPKLTEVETCMSWQILSMFWGMVQVNRTALMLAAEGGHVEAMNALLHRGATIESQDSVCCLFSS